MALLLWSRRSRRCSKRCSTCPPASSPRRHAARRRPPTRGTSRALSSARRASSRSCQRRCSRTHSLLCCSRCFVLLRQTPRAFPSCCLSEVRRGCCAPTSCTSSWCALRERPRLPPRSSRPSGGHFQRTWRCCTAVSLQSLPPWRRLAHLSRTRRGKASPPRPTPRASRWTFRRRRWRRKATRGSGSKWRRSCGRLARRSTWRRYGTPHSPQRETAAPSSWRPSSASCSTAASRARRSRSRAPSRRSRRSPSLRTACSGCGSAPSAPRLCGEKRKAARCSACSARASRSCWSS
mmetsp:Transcript_22213/g.50883  ORF Transcript_22213/g.50883 Transcript_22213/m.50883 type:complete len:293 (-) Transcript_22213:280-1158(-)